MGPQDPTEVAAFSHGRARGSDRLVLAAAPSVLVELLLGAAPGTAAGVTVSRVAGVALLALGVACWLARQTRPAVPQED